MELNEFLNKYNRIMNNSEISDIEDIELREIKRKYWDLRHNAFIDETNISDSDLEKVWDNSLMQEKQELIMYFNRYLNN